MTAYDIITAKTEISTVEIYEQLVKDLVDSFFAERNYEKRLSLHREPVVFKNEILREVYDAITKIQWRQELKYEETKNGIGISGYVNTKVDDIFNADSRLNSKYEALKIYCDLFEKDINILGAHLAEFQSLMQLADFMNRALREIPKNNTTQEMALSSQLKGKRATIPRKILLRLTKEANNKCVYCDFDDPALLDVHHIDEDRTHKDPERLIMVCPTCHRKIGNGEITRDEVENRKKELVGTTQVEVRKEKKVIINTSKANISSIGPTTLVVKKTTKKIVQKYPPGCIGYETNKANYISHLIERYHQYKEWEVGKAKMNYAILNSQLKKQFKVGKQRTIFNIPIERFEELALIIQSKIDNTKFGRINSKKHANYSPFSE